MWKRFGDTTIDNIFNLAAFLTITVGMVGWWTYHVCFFGITRNDMVNPSFGMGFLLVLTTTYVLVSTFVGTFMVLATLWDYAKSNPELPPIKLKRAFGSMSVIAILAVVTYFLWHSRL